MKASHLDLETKYHGGEVSLCRIRNRNELRVVKLLSEVLREFPDFEPDSLYIQEVYARALNNLPPHYAQEITIDPHNPIDDNTARNAIRTAVERVNRLLKLFFRNTQRRILAGVSITSLCLAMRVESAADEIRKCFSPRSFGNLDTVLSQL